MSSAPAGTLVAIPFLAEDPGLVARTLIEAASHPAVSKVIGIHGGRSQTRNEVFDLVKGLRRIELIAQMRVGSLRVGKGDAMNTGFTYFLDGPWQRLHFYDADIKTFHAGWIEKAEAALDAGFPTVRYFFPRARTDGMITWMITRPGFGLLWPKSTLSQVEQPLAGEIALSRDAVEVLARDPVVKAQSDWGIDAVLAQRGFAHGLGLYECFAPEGKEHQLYSTLADLKTMLLESLQALQRLRSSSFPKAVRHEREQASRPVASVIDQVAYDRAATERLLERPWHPDAERILNQHFEAGLVRTVLAWERHVSVGPLDPRSWLGTLKTLLDYFQMDSAAWREIAFRLWAGRVLHHTEAISTLDYWEAMSLLAEQVELSTG